MHRALLNEDEDKEWLSRPEQDMKANKVVEYPPRGGVLDTFAFVVRKGRLVVLERIADAVL
jgi:hypothetical protein